MKKPSELLKLYSNKLFTSLELNRQLLTFDISFRYHTLNIASASGYAIFRNGWILEFKEIIAQEGIAVNKIKYRYHLMDKDKELVFRYDNVAHFPKFKTHPHHKHIVNKVIESNGPELIDVIDEVVTMMVRESLRKSVIFYKDPLEPTDEEWEANN